MYIQYDSLGLRGLGGEACTKGVGRNFWFPKFSKGKLDMNRDSENPSNQRLGFLENSSSSSVFGGP